MFSSAFTHPVIVLACIIVFAAAYGHADIVTKTDGQRAVETFEAKVGRTLSDTGFAPIGDGRLLVWGSRGGRCCPGHVGVYEADGSVTLFGSFGEIRHVKVMQSTASIGPMAVVQFVAGAGTGLHEEKIAVYALQQQPREIWRSVVRYSSEGPYPLREQALSHVTIAADAARPRIVQAVLTVTGDSEEESCNEPSLESREYVYSPQAEAFVRVEGR